MTLHFGDLTLFDDISFVISPGEKVALLGKNGAGKTTLIKILKGELQQDEGTVSFPKSTKVAHLSQHLEVDPTKKIKEVCFEAFQDFFTLQNNLHTAHDRLAELKDEQEINRLLIEIGDMQTALDAHPVTNPEAEIARILRGLGFTEAQFDNPVSTLSGGWQMRVQMARLLLSRPDLLLLDEPDNHLDIEALIWFEQYVKSYQGAVLFISHDIQFIKNVANRILELSNKRIHDFKGSYEKYIEARAIRKEKELQAWQNQQKMIKSRERTIDRFMAKATKTKMAQSMKKQLDKIELIEPESDDITRINITFPVVHDPGKTVLRIQNLNKSYGDNKVLENVSMEIHRGQKVAFVGQNGQGKSTLVKIIAGVLSYEQGDVELGHNVLTNYFAQNQSETLEDHLTVLETLEQKADPEFQTRARHILGAFAFSGEDVDKKVSVLSGGERSRLAMACLVSRKSNFLILDEPTNHLDIHAKAILKAAIAEYPGTLVIVSHDRDILSGTVDVTYEFRNREVIQHLGDLDYVLQKRNNTDIRDFTLGDTDAGNKGESLKKKDQLSYEEQKKIKNRISSIERDIDKLEKEIERIHQKLMDPEFYNSAKSAEAMKKLKSLENSLNAKMEEWDGIVSEHDV